QEDAGGGLVGDLYTWRALERVGIGDRDLRVQNLAFLELRSGDIGCGDVHENTLELGLRAPEIRVPLHLHELIRFVLDELEWTAGYRRILEEWVLLQLLGINRAENVLGQDLEAEEADAWHEASVG